MAMQARDKVIDWEWFTPRRVRALRELADDRKGREAAERLGMSYAGFRSTVEELKDYLGYSDVDDIRRWWRAQRDEYVVWHRQQAGC